MVDISWPSLLKITTGFAIVSIKLCLVVGKVIERGTRLQLVLFRVNISQDLKNSLGNLPPPPAPSWLSNPILALQWHSILNLWTILWASNTGSYRESKNLQFSATTITWPPLQNWTIGLREIIKWQHIPRKLVVNHNCHEGKSTKWIEINQLQPADVAFYFEPSEGSLCFLWGPLDWKTEAKKINFSYSFDLKVACYRKKPK